MAKPTTTAKAPDANSAYSQSVQKLINNPERVSVGSQPAGKGPVGPKHANAERLLRDRQ